MISDEIHCDIVDPGYKYVPALSIAKDIITCIAPSKVFNLAGLHSALTVVNDPELKEKVADLYETYMSLKKEFEDNQNLDKNKDK